MLTTPSYEVDLATSPSDEFRERVDRYGLLSYRTEPVQPLLAKSFEGVGYAREFAGAFNELDRYVLATIGDYCRWALTETAWA